MLVLRMNELLDILMRNTSEICGCDVSTCIRCAARRQLEGRNNVIQSHNHKMYHKKPLSIFVAVRNEGRAKLLQSSALRESLVETCFDEAYKARVCHARKAQRKLPVTRICDHMPGSIAEAMDYDAWIEEF